MQDFFSAPREMWLRIESFQNRRVKEARALRKSDQRRLTGRIVIDGVREIQRASQAGVKIEELFFCPPLAPDQARDLVERIASQGATILEVSPRIFQAVAYGEREEGLVAIARAPQNSLTTLPSRQSAEAPLILVAEDVEKPGNLGAMIRTADGAGATAVIAADLQTDLYNPTIIRASLGTIFSLPVAAAQSDEVLQYLKDQNVQIVAARVEASTPYFQVDMTLPTAIVLGSEARGLSEKWIGREVTTVSIPMLGQADSLNVSVAAAILLYEARRQRIVGDKRM